MTMEVLSRPTKPKKNLISEDQGAVDNTSISRAIVKIKVFGVGGGGGNVLKRLAEYGLRDVELIAVNTDAHALSLLNVPQITEIQNSNDYDDFTINSNKAEWKDVLSIYAVVMTNGNDASEVITIDELNGAYYLQNKWRNNFARIFAKNTF